MADPMGWNTPSVVAEDMRAFKERFPSVNHIQLHLHNTRGQALTSAYAALTALGPQDTLEIDTGIAELAAAPTAPMAERPA